jgi:hypothetical protein
MFMGKPGRPARDISCPDDFDARLIDLGRIGCMEHYGVGRLRIDEWLVERGKERLIQERAEMVRKRHEEQHQADRLKELGKLLSHSFPVEDRRIVSDELASAAAQHLRIRRNGGFLVSPTGAGDWWIGTRRCSAAELVDLAVAKGFVPSLTGGGGSEVG